jgi:hypothetical protein
MPKFAFLPRTMSEIDMIFASKGKAKATDPQPAEAPALKSSKKKKKAKKNKLDPQPVLQRRAKSAQPWKLLSTLLFRSPPRARDTTPTKAQDK